MADTYTPNLNLTKPEVGASRDTWGGKTNGDWDIVDAIFAAAGSGTSVGLNVGSGKTLTVAGTQNVSGTFKTDTVSEYTAAAGVTVDGVLLKDSGAVLGAGAVGTPSVTTTGDTNTGLYFPAADTLAATTGGTERLRIDSSGNVGIGTSSPGTKLQVNGNLALGDAIITGTGTSTGDTNIELGGNRTGSGNSFLDFHSTASGDFEGRIIRTAGANGNFEVINTGTGAIYLTQNGAAPILFLTSSTERARITSGGDFFVNAAALPAGTHTVAGTIYSQGFYSNYGIGSHSGVGGAYQSNAINFQWNGSAVRLWVDTTDIGSITVSSDYRVKKDIKTQAATALDRVLQIRPVTYTYADYAPFSWKADGVSREGFIAHELAEIIPSAVEGAKDEPNKVQSLKLDALCSVLVKAIQELKADFDAYKAAHP